LLRLLLVTLLSLHCGAAVLVGGFQWMRSWSWVESDGFICGPFVCGGDKGGCVAFGPGQQRLNVLIAGLDYNHDTHGMPYSRGARTDTLMVVSLAKDAEFCNVVSIPRDTLTSAGKINEAYGHDGIKSTIEAVEELLGISLDRHVILKLHGAKKFVDALGGLEVEVPRHLTYTDSWARLSIDLEPGRQILSGDQVLGYARYLDPVSGDHGRVQRQQQLVKAGVKKLKDPAVALKGLELAKAFQECAETDLKIVEMVDLAMLYRDLDPRKLRAAQLVGDDRVVNGASVVVPYAPANRAMVRSLLGPPRPKIVVRSYTVRR